MFEISLNERPSRIDRLQVVALLGLMLVGGAFVYSATMVSESARLAPWYNQAWFRQILWYVLGTGAATLLCCVGYHTLARWSMVAYWVAMSLLVGGCLPLCGNLQRLQYDVVRATLSATRTAGPPTSWSSRLRRTSHACFTGAPTNHRRSSTG